MVQCRPQKNGYGFLGDTSPKDPPPNPYPFFCGRLYTGGRGARSRLREEGDEEWLSAVGTFAGTKPGEKGVRRVSRGCKRDVKGV